MSAIQKAIQEARFEIPEEILNQVFIQREFGRTSLPVSVDAMIREKVINARVMVDCNLMGGTQVELPLSGVQAERVDIAKTIYRVPMSITQNRRISRVLSLTIGTNTTMGASFMGVEGYSQILDAAQGLMNSHGTIPVISTASLRLIAENTILVSDFMAIPRAMFLRCYLENDSEYSTLNPTTYTKFAELCLLAIKAYIYTNQKIKMGRAELSGGMDLGAFKEVVDEYRDANQLYREMLRERWVQTMALDDPRTKERILRQLMGGNW